jgi:hypothetical protein
MMTSYLLVLEYANVLLVVVLLLTYECMAVPEMITIYF